MYTSTYTLKDLSQIIERICTITKIRLLDGTNIATVEFLASLQGKKLVQDFENCLP